MCERNCLVESEVVGFEEDLFPNSLVGETSDEPIANVFIDARRSNATACCEGTQLGKKLLAVFTDVLVTSLEFFLGCRLPTGGAESDWPD